ncbi:PREDICTED: uncharacterized protein LOC105556681 [Vollenhovia emeryi]|uniref:uncharacterized protein LOC105556681 n=1 Tax=Vollenhovia emeryi TaxID=411798 RepID=UPI0005F39185|nr:PREDICTED: uncharacterized protein LOC105556681 [Vollenhovia emeryi]
MGNFSRCTSRFDGKKTFDVEAFIDAITTYKDCTNISDENALKGLPILLTDLAATWWLGIKHTVNTWKAAIDLLRKTYGPKKPAYRIYKELFSLEQEGSVSTDIFVCKARALISKLPYDPPLLESVQLDMVYGLLSYKIQKEVSHEKVTSFAELLDRAREIEETIAEEIDTSKRSPRKDGTRPRCKYCKNFGHTIDDCKSITKKPEENSTAHNKKSKTNSDAEDAKATNPRPQSAITCFGCGNPGYLRRDCPKCNKNKGDKDEKSETKPEFCLIDASEIRARYRNRPILKVEILGAKGTGLIDTAAKLSVAGHSLYKILIKKGQVFEESNLRIGLADGTRSEKRVLTTKVNVRLQDRVVNTTFIVMPYATNNYTLLGTQRRHQAVTRSSRWRDENLSSSSASSGAAATASQSRRFGICR